MSTENLTDVQDDTVKNENEGSSSKKSSDNKKSKKKDKVSELEDEVEELNIQLKEQNDKFLRLYAEFDNFKKRTAKERLELIKTAGQEVILDLLDVLDDLDRAEQSIAKNSDFETAKTGFHLIKEKLIRTLQSKGLETMDSKGKPFDPDLHEAITDIPAPTEDMKGKVIDVIEKGYTLNQKIIRYAKVVVGK